MSATILRARLEVAPGAAARALAPRFAEALAARTTLGVDRVQEVGLVMDALVDGYDAILPGQTLDVAVSDLRSGIELAVGPLPLPQLHRVLAHVAERGPHGGVVSALASPVEVRPGREGRARLVLTVR